MKTLKTLSFIPLVLFVLISGCKKPKPGYWIATFTDDKGSSMSQKEMVLKKRGDKFIADLYSPHGRVEGELYFKNSKITKGNVSSWYSFSGHSSSFSYYNFSGILSRKSITGTYSYTKTLEYSSVAGPPIDSTSTGTGTFVLKFSDKKKDED